MAVMAEGYMVDELGGNYVHGSRIGWRLDMPSGNSFRMTAGPGRLSRLGFTTVDASPHAALLLMQPVTNNTQIDVTPSPVLVLDDEPYDGALILSATTPVNVHMTQPSFTSDELYRLLHTRRMHPANTVLVASHVIIASRLGIALTRSAPTPSSKRARRVAAFATHRLCRRRRSQPRMWRRFGRIHFRSACSTRLDRLRCRLSFTATGT